MKQDHATMQRPADKRDAPSTHGSIQADPIRSPGFGRQDSPPRLILQQNIQKAIVNNPCPSFLSSGTDSSHCLACFHAKWLADSLTHQRSVTQQSFSETASDMTTSELRFLIRLSQTANYSNRLHHNEQTATRTSEMHVSAVAACVP